MFSKVKPRGTLRVEGKQNSLFPEGPVIKCFVIPPDSKVEKNCEKMICLRTFALIFSAQPNCAGKYTCHVMHECAC